MKMMVDVNKTTGLEAELTHKEIAKVLGVSRSYVSYLEKSALDKIRKALADRHDIRSSNDLL